MSRQVGTPTPAYAIACTRGAAARQCRANILGRGRDSGAAIAIGDSAAMSLKYLRQARNAAPDHLQFFLR